MISGLPQRKSKPSPTHQSSQKLPVRYNGKCSSTKPSRKFSIFWPHHVTENCLGPVRPEDPKDPATNNHTAPRYVNNDDDSIAWTTSSQNNQDDVAEKPIAKHYSSLSSAGSPRPRMKHSSTTKTKPWSIFRRPFSFFIDQQGRRSSFMPTHGGCCSQRTAPAIGEDFALSLEQCLTCMKFNPSVSRGSQYKDSTCEGESGNMENNLPSWGPSEKGSARSRYPHGAGRVEPHPGRRVDGERHGETVGYYHSLRVREMTAGRALVATKNMDGSSVDDTTNDIFVCRDGNDTTLLHRLHASAAVDQEPTPDHREPNPERPSPKSIPQTHTESQHPPSLSISHRSSLSITLPNPPTFTSTPPSPSPDSDFPALSKEHSNSSLSSIESCISHIRSSMAYRESMDIRKRRTAYDIFWNERENGWGLEEGEMLESCLEGGKER